MLAKLVENAKEGKPLSGRVYSMLFGVGLEEHKCALFFQWNQTPVTESIQSMVEPSYVRKPCYATTMKHASMKEELKYNLKDVVYSSF